MTTTRRPIKYHDCQHAYDFAHARTAKFVAMPAEKQFCLGSWRLYAAERTELLKFLARDFPSVEFWIETEKYPKSGTIRTLYGKIKPQ